MIGRAPAALLCAVLATACAEPPPPAPALAADAEGFFAFPPPDGWAEAFPAGGVRCLFRRDGLLVGRLAEDAGASVSFHVRDDDGRLAMQTLAVARSAPSARDAFRDAVAGVAADAIVRAEERGTGDAAFSRVLGAAARGAGGPEVPPASPPPLGARPRLGAQIGRIDSVLDCAPDDLVFVRVRSVETAYRFADEIDRLDFLLRAAAGDARDFGTLAATLRRLHLPTIWLTNPEAERGVGELGIVLAPPFERGPQRAAVLLHVTDPELHRMQTEARKAYPEPSTDDPFPDRRSDVGARRMVGDLEIVSADAELLDHVATPSAYSIRRMTPYLRVRARLNEGSTEPPREEALMLYVSPAARERLAATPAGSGTSRSTRYVEEGLRWLAARLTGLPEPGGSVLVADAPEEHLLADVEWAVVVTHPTPGATVRVRFTTSERAAAAGSALRALASSGARWGEACERNLRGIAPIALVEPSVADLAQRTWQLLGWRPVCPCGGAYAVDAVTRVPRCSEHGAVEEFVEAPPPASRVEHVAVQGSELSFDLRIDWDADTSRPR